jgi:hypothetical protein
MKKKILVISLPAILLLTLTAGVMSDNGIAGHAGSSGETPCTNCHNSYAINSGAGSIQLRTGMTNNEYVPGQAYDMTFKVAYTGRSLFGMGLEALNSSNGNAGTIVITDAVHTTTKSATVGTTSRKSVVHTLNGGASTDSMPFHFRWIAPTTGTVTFYYCGVAANGNAATTADYVYSGSMVVNPVSTGINTVSNDLSFSVFPNPASESLRISFKSNTSGQTTFSLYDLSGKLVKSESHNVTSGNNFETEWNDISSFQKGVYLLNVRNTTGETTKRVVIN